MHICLDTPSEKVYNIITNAQRRPLLLTLHLKGTEAAPSGYPHAPMDSMSAEHASFLSELP